MFDYDTVIGSNCLDPYNIVKTGGNKFDIEVVLQVSIKDIDVTSENGMLTIESKEDDKSKDKDGEVLHMNTKVFLKDTLKNLLQSVMMLKSKAQS